MTGLFALSALRQKKLAITTSMSAADPPQCGASCARTGLHDRRLVPGNGDKQGNELDINKTINLRSYKPEILITRQRKQRENMSTQKKSCVIADP
jgi:hypothetical protein